MIIPNQGVILSRFVRTTDKFQIMPNHIHMIIQIVGAHHDAPIYVYAPNEHDRTHIRAIHESPLRRSLLSQIIGYFKMNSAKTIHITNPNIRIWQRNYYEHIIKNETEYIKIERYIQSNPSMWG